jgi:hypothetical protein
MLISIEGRWDVEFFHAEFHAPDLPAPESHAMKSDDQDRMRLTRRRNEACSGRASQDEIRAVGCFPS